MEDDQNVKLANSLPKPATFVCLEFVWNVEEDFKPVPDTWIPAKDIEFSNGNPLPDENGHMPGTYDAGQVKMGGRGRQSIVEVN